MLSHFCTLPKQCSKQQSFGLLQLLTQLLDLNPIEHLWALVKRLLTRNEVHHFSIIELRIACKKFDIQFQLRINYASHCAPDMDNYDDIYERWYRTRSQCEMFRVFSASISYENLSGGSPSVKRSGFPQLQSVTRILVVGTTTTCESPFTKQAFLYIFSWN